MNWLEEATHRRLAVHTLDERTFEGVLRVAADDGLLLWNAALAGDTPIVLEGEVFVPRSNVSFVQTLRQ